jgi:hypothetical protein
VRRRIDLHRRAAHDSRANADRRHIEDHAVEIEKHLVAQRDVRPIIAIERRLDPRLATGLRNQLTDQPRPLLLLIVAGVVDRLGEQPRPPALGA